MPPKCNIYFQKGVEAGLLEGKMTSEDMAACNIYRIQKGIKAPGLGKGGKRSTRRGRKAASGTRRMRGGERGACWRALKNMFPDESEYARMQEEGCSAIDTGNSYEEFQAHQAATLEALSAAECAFVTHLCGYILADRVSHTDLESCAVFGTAGIFFDQAGKLVTYNQR